MLRTLNYDKNKSRCIGFFPKITTQSFETLSTTTTTDDHYLFFQGVSQFRIYIAKKRATISWSSPLYQHIKDLTIEISFYSSILNSLLNIGKNNIL
jgi:hypothetical protein